MTRARAFGVMVISLVCMGCSFGRPIRVNNRSGERISLYWRSGDKSADPGTPPKKVMLDDGHVIDIEYGEGQGYEPERRVLLVRVGENRLVEVELPKGRYDGQHVRVRCLGCPKEASPEAGKSNKGCLGGPAAKKR